MGGRDAQPAPVWVDGKLSAYLKAHDPYEVYGKSHSLNKRQIGELKKEIKARNDQFKRALNKQSRAYLAGLRAKHLPVLVRHSVQKYVGQPKLSSAMSLKRLNALTDKKTQRQIAMRALQGRFEAGVGYNQSQNHLAEGEWCAPLTIEKADEMNALLGLKSNEPKIVISSPEKQREMDAMLKHVYAANIERAMNKAPLIVDFNDAFLYDE